MKPPFSALTTLCLTIVLAISSCGPDRFSDNKIIVGVSIPTQREERWVRDVQKLREEAKRLNIDLRLQISDNDATRQLAQCENLIAQNIDILILAPHDASAAAIIVEKAHQAGVKVISYDRLITNADVDIYLSFDNVKVGYLQGRYLTGMVPRGRYVVLAGAPTDNNATLFHEGAMSVIKPLAEKEEIEVVMNQSVKDWQPNEAMKLMENALTANNNRIDAVLAPNDGTAGGVIQALAQQKLDGKVPVTGQDAELSAAKRIVAGTQAMTIFKDTRQLASVAMEVAFKLIKGVDPGINSRVGNGKKEVPSLLLTPIVVDRKNIDSILIDSGYLKRDAVYGPQPSAAGRSPR
jgi:D-xylose transport system substrate-binding protein